MSKKVSVVIRNKNQEKNLEFSLFNLSKRYSEDIDEIVVIDNDSTDNSRLIGEKYGVKWVNISDFGYGKSANLAAKSASHEIVVIFSAHAFPISHDFFKLIKNRFEENPKLAGVRCIHTERDYKMYINGVAPEDSPIDSALLFAGSAFSKKVWEKIPFKDSIVTFEDKEWSLRVLKEGYELDLVPAIFCYDLKRTPASYYFRFKTETQGNYDLWGTKIRFSEVAKKIVFGHLGLVKMFFVETYFMAKTNFFLIYFILFKQSSKK
ncbi:glycosyltransferase [Algoriphagus kandeliae]|uniref:Glycosyltransferase n=1 Tax=Algoriphagus kandeliae TaxID=2562278 RepID=A0A4Y9QZQ7_9BACT|nr:glycosyltransferase [Algoriphagus kandeliae]TFV97228.1 glycosyltransferase [Algoriphagus kandeliae]